MQSTFKSLKRANTLAVRFAEYRKDIEVRICEVRKDLDALKESGRSSDGRLTRVEIGIVDLRAAVQRSDEQFNCILQELKALPRVTALMESFSHAITSIVPRTEVESRLASAEQRLSLVEQDVRVPVRP